MLGLERKYQCVKCDKRMRKNGTCNACGSPYVKRLTRSDLEKEDND